MVEGFQRIRVLRVIHQAEEMTVPSPVFSSGIEDGTEQQDIIYQRNTIRQNLVSMTGSAGWMDVVCWSTNLFFLLLQQVQLDPVYVGS